MTRLTLAGAALAAVIGTTAAQAGVEVQVQILGEVEFNLINSGELGMMNSGDVVEINFTVDSNNFVDGSFPTRGYVINEGSFSFTAGAANLGLQSPYQGVPYFILRNDDPAVDGFLFGSDPDVAFPNGIALDQTGIFEDFRANYGTTYLGDTLSSLDIVDAVGTYDFDGLTVFSMGILDGGNDAAGFVFSEMTISLVPAPATLVLLAPFGLVARRRRR